MSQPSPRSPTSSSEPKLALTRDRIVAAAVDLADAEGIDAVSMRKVATRLGAGAMSLYRHVANRDEMIEAMVDLVCTEIVEPQPGPDWRDSIRASSASAHKALLAHPWAAAEWPARPPGPERVRYMEALLRVLTEAGLDRSLVYRGYHAITMHIVGFTLQEIGFASGPVAQNFDVTDEVLAGMRDAGLLHLAEHLIGHAEEDYGDEFGFVLDLILDGLVRADSS